MWVVGTVTFSAKSQTYAVGMQSAVGTQYAVGTK